MNLYLCCPQLEYVVWVIQSCMIMMMWSCELAHAYIICNTQFTCIQHHSYASTPGYLLCTQYYTYTLRFFRLRCLLKQYWSQASWCLNVECLHQLQSNYFYIITSDTTFRSLNAYNSINTCSKINVWDTLLTQMYIFKYFSYTSNRFVGYALSM